MNVRKYRNNDLHVVLMRTAIQAGDGCQKMLERNFERKKKGVLTC